MRNLNLTTRREETREKRYSRVIKFEIEQIKEHFDENISDIENQFKIIDMLDKDKDKDKIDCILRSQIVFLGSSIDFYFHEITKYGLMKIYDKVWEKTDNYKKIKINIEEVFKALEAGNDSEWFIEFIDSEYRGITMMSWRSITNQIELIGLDIDEIAEKVFPNNDLTKQKKKDELKKVVTTLFKRRNFIAHQFDRRHNDAIRKDISKTEVVNFIKDIKKIVYAVHETLLEK